jgi:hypothetical protein
MPEAFFPTFCLRLGLGMVAALLVLPRGVVSPRFFKIHLLIVLALAVAAGMAAWSAAGDVLWIGLGIAAAACFIGTWCWTIDAGPVGYSSLFLVIAGLLAGVLTLTIQPETGLPTIIWRVADDLTAAGVLGLGLTAMLMGHWYLISPTMSIQPLIRLLGAFMVATLLRMLVSAIALWPWVDGTLRPDGMAWIWLGLRWGVGFVGCLVLGWMAWQTARIRSTQSATGILYVVVIFVFFGELSDQLLQEHLRGLTHA